MAQTKPTKPTNLMPRHFADDGVKSNFSPAKISSGFSANFDDILQGDNLNYTLDTIGKELEYLSSVVDFIVDMPINKTFKVNASNNLEYVNLVEDVSNRANISLDNLNSTGQAKLDAKVNKSDLRKIDCVIYDLHEGTDWVRIWSDGWCEQGGEFPSSWNWQSIEVPLIQPYKDEHYHVSITPGWNSAVGSNYNSIKTPSKFSCLVLSNYYAGYGIGTWKASGYIR